MFMDIKRSTQYLKDHQKEYLFSELSADRMQIE
jgi:hypothetical protein